MRKTLRRICSLGLALGMAFPALGGAEKTVTLTFTGDVTLGSEEINKDKPNSFNGYAEREGYGWFFRNMKELFSGDDLTIVNLEGTLTDSSFQEDTTKTFRFRGKRWRKTESCTAGTSIPSSSKRTASAWASLPWAACTWAGTPKP